MRGSTLNRQSRSITAERVIILGLILLTLPYLARIGWGLFGDVVPLLVWELGFLVLNLAIAAGIVLIVGGFIGLVVALLRGKRSL